MNGRLHGLNRYHTNVQNGIQQISSQEKSKQKNDVSKRTSNKIIRSQKTDHDRQNNIMVTVVSGNGCENQMRAYDYMM